MDEPLALVLLRRFRRTLEKVTVPESDELGIFEVNLTYLRDVVHPVTEEHVVALLATGATESAGHVLQHYLSISDRVLGAEMLLQPHLARVSKARRALNREAAAMTRPIPVAEAHPVPMVVDESVLEPVLEPTPGTGLPPADDRPLVVAGPAAAPPAAVRPEPATPADVRPAPASGRTTMAEVLAGFVEQRRRQERPATMANDSRS